MGTPSPPLLNCRVGRHRLSPTSPFPDGRLGPGLVCFQVEGIARVNKHERIPNEVHDACVLISNEQILKSTICRVLRHVYADAVLSCHLLDAASQKRACLVIAGQKAPAF
eukprot:scaffold59035_cov63-Phaeocystis_antarctica.AAC.2